MSSDRIWSRDMEVEGEGGSRENTGQIFKVGSRKGKMHIGVYDQGGSTKR